MPQLRHFLTLPLLVSTAPITFAQPDITPPAPQVALALLPKEPLIEPAARVAVEALAARYRAIKSYSDVTKMTDFDEQLRALLP